MSAVVGKEFEAFVDMPDWGKPAFRSVLTMATSTALGLLALVPKLSTRQPNQDTMAMLKDIHAVMQKAKREIEAKTGVQGEMGVGGRGCCGGCCGFGGGSSFGLSFPIAPRPLMNASSGFMVISPTLAIKRAED